MPSSKRPPPLHAAPSELLLTFASFYATTRYAGSTLTGGNLASGACHPFLAVSTAESLSFGAVYTLVWLFGTTFLAAVLP